MAGIFGALLKDITEPLVNAKEALKKTNTAKAIKDTFEQMKDENANKKVDKKVAEKVIEIKAELKAEKVKTKIMAKEAAKAKTAEKPTAKAQ